MLKCQTITASRELVDSLKDETGQLVDEGIKPLLIALVALGFETSASCSGHTDNSTDVSYPYVILNTPAPTDEWNEAERERWLKANLQQQATLYEHLEAFYKRHQPDSLKSMLILNTFGAGITELRPYGGAFFMFEPYPADLHKVFLREINAFAAYLIKKAEA